MKTYLKKISALLIAMVMTLAMCTTAFAATPSANDTATITVEGVEAGATVTAYLIVKPVYDVNGNGLVGYEEVYENSIDDLEAPTAAELSDLEVTVTNDTTATSYTLVETSSGSYTASVGAGMYLIVVTNADTKVYNLMVVSVNYLDANVTSDSNPSDGTVDAAGDYKLNGATVYAKSSEITVDKDVNGNETADDVSVGSTVSYTITGTIPSYDPDYYTNPTYVIKDTGTNLTYNYANIVVTIGTTTATKVDSASSDSSLYEYTLNQTSDGFEITFLNVEAYRALTAEQREVTVSYTATVTSDAYSYNPATNTASVTYSNDPDDSESTDTVTDETYVYTFELNNLDKVGDTDDDGDGKLDGLAGATFTLYSDASMKTVVGTYTTVSTNDYKIVFNGLDAETYYLTETDAPEGYSINNTVYKIEIDSSYGTDGKLSSYTVKITDTSDSTNEAVTYTVTPGTSAETTTITGTGVTIQNTTLSSLPSTGGMGTYIFTIVGVLVMAVMASMFVMKRRRDASAE